MSKATVFKVLDLYKCIQLVWLDFVANLSRVPQVLSMKRYHELIAPYARLPAHEHISRIAEIVTGEHSVYVFFARSHGDMHSYVRSCKRLREEEASSLFGQMAEAVAHCHQHGVVLRDLKLRKFVFTDKQR